MYRSMLHESSDKSRRYLSRSMIRKLHLKVENLPFTVEKSEEEADTFIVEGPSIEKMLGYTNLESEKGFQFFQNFLKENGILEQLEAARRQGRVTRSGCMDCSLITTNSFRQAHYDRDKQRANLFADGRCNARCEAAKFYFQTSAADHL